MQALLAELLELVARHAEAIAAFLGTAFAAYVIRAGRKSGVADQGRDIVYKGDLLEQTHEADQRLEKSIARMESKLDTIIGHLLSHKGQ